MTMIDDARGAPFTIRPGLNVGAALHNIGIVGGRPWARQVEIVRAVFGPRRITAVQSATSTGKTHIAAHIAWAWLSTGKDRIVITTAPTGRQVSGAVWKEMRVIYNDAEARGVPIGGKLAPRAPSWFFKEGWQALGYSSTDPVNYAGWHSRGGTLVIIDDAQGCENDTWDTLQATLTGANDRLLALANPVAASGRFFEYCTKTGADDVNRIKVSAFDTPNLIAGRTVIDGLVSPEDVESKRRVWGEGSALWKSRVLGEFPEADDTALIPMAWVLESVDAWREWRERLSHEKPESRTLSADIAGMGRDHGVSAELRDYQLRDPKTQLPFVGRWFAPLFTHPKVEPMATTGLLVQQHTAIKPRSFRVDADGMGGPIVDRLKELGIPVVGMRGGMAAEKRDRFANARAEWHMAFRDALRPHRDGFRDDRPYLWLPADDALVHQATSIRVGALSDGRIKIEAKEDWIARQTGDRKRSPDELDAVIMAVCDEPSGDDAGGVAAYLAAYG
jgi:phage terminase large subunit